MKRGISTRSLQSIARADSAFCLHYNKLQCQTRLAGRILPFCWGRKGESDPPCGAGDLHLLKLSFDVWNRIHELGISRKRKTHRGSKGKGRRRSAQNFLQSTNLQAIPVLIRPREKANVRNLVCVKNLISIKPVNNNNASINRKYDMPNLFLTNARSLKNKFDEITVVVNKYDVDFLAITETWLDANTPIDYFPLSGFSTFSKPRTDKKGGGVAAYISECSKCCKSPWHLYSTEFKVGYTGEGNVKKMQWKIVHATYFETF